jgi:3-hydroxyisobutyrate dehydrogenase
MDIGFIGLGTMGAGMATNLQKAGHALTVHDVRRDAAREHLDRGAAWAETPRQVAERVEVVFLSLPGPREVDAVALGADGVLAGLRAGGACFDLSTNAPARVRGLSAAFAGQGKHLLDAPVSGGPRGAATKKLTVWVGGERGVFDRYRPVLEGFSDQVFFAGPIGAGSITKLVHNCVGRVLTAALAEAFTLGVKAGMDPLALFESIRAGVIGRRRTFDGLIDQFLPRKLEPAAFTLRLAHKDVALAMELARELSVPMRLTNLTLDEMTEALNRGWGELDTRAFTLLQQERAGVEIKVDPEQLRTVVARG